jgi:hypothetical protein
MKKKKRKFVNDLLKTAHRISREEEIELFGKPINHFKIAKSKKKYTRKHYKVAID